MIKNICIVGYGAVGETHAEVVSEMEQVNLYAACDVLKERLDQCKEKYNTLSYLDFDEMLKDENIDSVHICTPHYLHFEMIKKALRAGKQVVCEKPVTRTRAEYEELLTTENADQVCVVMQNRLNPCVSKMKEITDSGELGKIASLKAVVTWNRPSAYYAQAAWRGMWATEGGGVLINQSIHTLDALIYILGKVNRVQAHMANYTHPEIEVEDMVSAHLSFENGANGIFYASNSYGATVPAEIEIIFEKGKLHCVNGKLYVNDEYVTEDSVPLTGKIVWGTGHKLLFKRYYDEGKHFSPFDITYTMDTLFSIYECAKNNGFSMQNH